VPVDARERFLSALAGVSDPEQKRKIIGKVFIDVFDEEAQKVDGAAYLVQGTLYPDVIESVSFKGPSAVIKSHHNEVWQSFCVLLPVRSVGVMGDQRTYEETCAIRAVRSVDGMTADWAPLPYEVLGRMSNRIINEVRGINRVVYDISSKPPATIEWE